MHFSPSPKLPFSLKFESAFKAIPKGFEWNDIPMFAVITGKNGAGKSQLLDSIAARSGVWQPHNPHQRFQVEESPKVEISIESMDYGSHNAYFARSAWSPPSGGSATDETLRQAILQFKQVTPGTTSWHLSKLAENTGISVDELIQKTPEELEQILTPTLIWAAQSPMGNGPLALLFLAYRHLERYWTSRGQSAEQIKKRIGPPPWEAFDEVLSAASLPFKIVPPAPSAEPYSLFGDSTYHAQLIDIERNVVVPYESLSSGERVIMSMARWLFTIEQTGHHFELLVLDEPDAHLHPSMTRRFIEVLKTTFVQKRGVRVIMSTHSPSTVALAPEGSLFVMTRGSSKLMPCRDRQVAINTLTEGFVVAHEGMQIVLCEGKTDAPFYKAVWERVSDEKGKSIIPMPRAPAIVFMYGQGKGTTVPVINKLRASGLTHFHALLDYDGLDKKAEGIHILNRAALENYLLDPICVWCFLAQQDPQQLPPIVQEQQPMAGTWHRVVENPSETLQVIADAILEKVAQHLPPGISTESVSVKFTNGLQLKYPGWLLSAHKSTLMPAFTRAYMAVRPENFDKLVNAFALVDLIPKDLFNLLREIQDPSSNGASMQLAEEAK